MIQIECFFFPPNHVFVLAIQPVLKWDDNGTHWMSIYRKFPTWKRLWSHFFTKIQPAVKRGSLASCCAVRYRVSLCSHLKKKILSIQRRSGRWWKDNRRKREKKKKTGDRRRWLFPRRTAVALFGFHFLRSWKSSRTGIEWRATSLLTSGRMAGY